MKIISTLFLIAAIPVYSFSLDVENMSFDELMGGNFTEIIESAKILAVEDVPFEIQNESEIFEIPAVRMGKISYEESEISRCPRNSEKISSEPDTDLFTYVGFKYVRLDDSTCLAQPSDKIYYRDYESDKLYFRSNQGNSFSYDYLTSEYRIKRYFFFRTHLDGTRQFYHYEKKDFFGRNIPEKVEIEFVNRVDYPILPWDKEEGFNLVYGRKDKALLSAYSANYEYKIQTVGEIVDGILYTKFKVEAVKRIRLTEPEKDVVSLTLEKKGDSLVANIRDIRAKYYKNEKIGLKIRLWRNVLLFDDKIAYDLDIYLDPASNIVIDFSDPKWDSFKNEGLKRWKEYYIEWSFRRFSSNISSGEWIEKEESNRVKL